MHRDHYLSVKSLLQRVISTHTVSGTHFRWTSNQYDSFPTGSSMKSTEYSCIFCYRSFRWQFALFVLIEGTPLCCQGAAIFWKWLLLRAGSIWSSWMVMAEVHLWPKRAKLPTRVIFVPSNMLFHVLLPPSTFNSTIFHLFLLRKVVSSPLFDEKVRFEALLPRCETSFDFLRHWTYTYIKSIILFKRSRFTCTA